MRLLVQLLPAALVLPSSVSAFKEASSGYLTEFVASAYAKFPRSRQERDGHDELLKPNLRIVATSTITEVHTKWVTTVSDHVSWCSGSCADSTANNQHQYQYGNFPALYGPDDIGEECYPDDASSGDLKSSMKLPLPLGQTSLQLSDYATPAVRLLASTSAPPASNGQVATVTIYTSTTNVVSTITVTQPVQVTNYGATVTVTDAYSIHTVTRVVTQTATVSETIIFGVLPPGSQNATNNQILPDTPLPPSLQISPPSSPSLSNMTSITVSSTALVTSEGQSSATAIFSSMTNSMTTTETTDMTSTASTTNTTETSGTTSDGETTMTVIMTGKLESLQQETYPVNVVPAGLQLMTNLSITTTETMTAIEQATATTVMADTLSSTSEPDPALNLVVSSSAAANLTLCPTRTVNPTYTATPLFPKNYTWGCPPGKLCHPEQGDCNFEVGPPAETYYCHPDECIDIPDRLPDQYWGKAVEGEDIDKYNVSPGYFNLNPIMFGLEYDDVFAFPSGVQLHNRGVMLLKRLVFPSTSRRPSLHQLEPRQSASANIPGACYDECNNCMLEAEATGKTPSLCLSDSAFRELLRECNECIKAHGSAAIGPEDNSIPDFAQFLSYCDSVQSESSSSSETASTTDDSNSSVSSTSTSTSTSTTSDNITSSSILPVNNIMTPPPIAGATTSGAPILIDGQPSFSSGLTIAPRPQQPAGSFFHDGTGQGQDHAESDNNNGMAPEPSYYYPGPEPDSSSSSNGGTRAGFDGGDSGQDQGASRGDTRSGYFAGSAQQNRPSLIGLFLASAMLSTLFHHPRLF